MRLREVLGQKWRLAIAASALALAVSYYLTIFSVTGGSISIYADMNGFWYTALTLGMSAAISVLFGVWAAMVSSAARPGISGFLGTLVGAAATGCPTCPRLPTAGLPDGKRGAPLLALAGMPLGLFGLPFWGLELKAVSVILISASIRSLLGGKDGCKL